MEYDYWNKFINYLQSDSFRLFIHNLAIILLIYLVILFIVIMPTFYFIFKREGEKPWYAFIPFWNIYCYLYFLNVLPPLAFVPGVNLVTVHFSVSELARLYRCNWLIRLFAWLLPPVALILIALNPHYCLDEVYYRDRQFLKTIEDVDILEEQLESQPQYIIDDSDVLAQDKPIDDSYRSYIDNKVDEIEQNAIKDDLDEDLMMLDSARQEQEIKEAKEKHENEVVEELIDSLEIQDLFSNNDIRTNKIDDIVNKVDDATKIEVVDNAVYKDVQEETKDIKNIAFGGIEQDTKVIKHAIQSKDSNVYCPNCNTPLKGNETSCPGCGKQLKK